MERKNIISAACCTAAIFTISTSTCNLNENITDILKKSFDKNKETKEWIPSVSSQNMENGENVKVMSINDSDWAVISSNYNVKKDDKKVIKMFIEDMVISSLKNIKYDWRTIKGLSNELEIPEKEILNTLINMAKNGKVFIGRKKNGEEIYSLIEVYEKNTSFLQKLKDAIIGRVIR